MSEIKTTKLIGENGVDAVNFTSGLNVTGVSTATNVSTASSVTAGTFFGNGAGVTGVSGGILLRKSIFTITRQNLGSHAQFPNDDTAPQITEGVEFFSQAYTPTNTSNCDLYIHCTASVGEITNIADDVGMALFISDQTDALRAVTDWSVHGANLTITHKMPSYSGTKTFSLRSHKGDGINYAADGYYQTKYGASTHASLFTIEEISTS